MSKMYIMNVSYGNLVVNRNGKQRYIKLDTLEDMINSRKWRVVKRKGREQVDHLEPV